MSERISMHCPGCGLAVAIVDGFAICPNGHRNDSDDAVRKVEGAAAERDRLAAEVERLTAEVDRLTRERDEAKTESHKAWVKTNSLEDTLWDLACECLRTDGTSEVIQELAEDAIREHFPEPKGAPDAVPPQ